MTSRLRELISRLGASLLDLARAFAREPGEMDRTDDRWAIFAKISLFGALTIGLLALFSYFFVPEVASWKKGRPELPVSPSAWRVLYSDPADAREVLWKSESRRTDPGHRARVRAMAGQVFWVGTRIQPELARRALESSAFQFILGYISASYQIWIDDELVAVGTYRESSNPVILSLPLQRVIREGGARIAIRIVHDSGNPVPDYFNSALGGEGFATYASVRSYLKSLSFLTESRPFAFALAQLILATLFFFFWRSSPKRQEYFYMACFTLVHAWIQFSEMDMIYRALGSEKTYALDCVLRMYEGAFALFLGLSFARAPRYLFQFAFPVFLAFPFLTWVLPFQDSTARLAFSATLGWVFVPAAYFGGAAACVLQGYLLYETRVSSWVRIRRLAFFGAALAFFGAFYLTQAGGISSATETVVLYRFVHLGIVLFLASVVIAEYRETEKLVTRTHLSKYHRRPVLPERVSGTILKVDLKGSTRLEAEAASLQYGKVSTIWFSWMAELILKNGGELLAEEGDLVVAFFDRETHSDPVARALETAAQMEARQQDLPKLFGLDRALHFRGSVVSGEILPVWKDSGSRRLPGYEGNVLVDASRLMDLEYDVAENGDKTLMVVETQELAGWTGNSWISDLVKKDSDGRERRVSLIWLGRARNSAQAA